METSRWNGQYDKEAFKFSRTFTVDSLERNQSSVGGVSRERQNHPHHRQQNQHRRNFGLLKHLRQLIFGDEGSEEENEDDIHRPPQPNAEPSRQQEQAVGASSTVFIQNCSLLINGKPTSSLDQMKATLTQCPEQYWTFMK